MYLLTRICLHNWNLIDAKDIEIAGATGMIGPTGVGKSTVLSQRDRIGSGPMSST
jgi:ABC-type enterochelin transport system ATPase subunit